MVLGVVKLVSNFLKVAHVRRRRDKADQEIRPAPCVSAMLSADVGFGAHVKNVQDEGMPESVNFARQSLKHRCN